MVQLVSAVSLAAEPPNMLFLIYDDLNCDIGAYGHPQVKTPNIDALAGVGVISKRSLPIPTLWSITGFIYDWYVSRPDLSSS